MITIEELNAQYAPPGGKFFELTDKEEALRQINSKTSCCWMAGSKIGNTGWIQLATDRPNTFVCKESLLA